MCIAQLTPEEAWVLVPLPQAFPAYAPYALVLASIENSTIEEAQYRLNTAWLQGADEWNRFLYPIRRAVGQFRLKLHACNTDIVAIRRKGYLLKQWKEKQ